MRKISPTQAAKALITLDREKRDPDELLVRWVWRLRICGRLVEEHAEMDTYDLYVDFTPAHRLRVERFNKKLGRLAQRAANRLKREIAARLKQEFSNQSKTFTPSTMRHSV